ncbi:protein of unknown function (plasmid) [Escherichia coli]|nr:protein of unknown function [Escherichia coli]VZZ91530.1 protein of unknown function [Escherichia coli]
MKEITHLNFNYRQLSVLQTTFIYMTAD